MVTDTEIPEYVGAQAPRSRPGAIRRTLGICLIVVTVVLATAAAYAYTSAGGTGSGTAATGTMQPVTISAFTGGDAPASTLIPGGTADVMLRISNSNAVPVRIFGVTSNGVITADLSHPACTTTGVSFAPPPTPISPTVTVGANSSVLIHLEGAASMDLTSSAACQGAAFNIPVTSTAHR